MEQNRNSYQVWWVYDQTITAVTTAVIPIGCNVLAAFSPAGNSVALVRDLRYFAFTLIGTYTTATLALKLEIGIATGALVTWVTHPHSGSTNVDTVHSVAAPYGNTRGVMGLAAQYLRVSVDVGGAGDVTDFLCMARAWK